MQIWIYSLIFLELEDDMKILHITTSDIGGGAARAAYRLHRALLNEKVDSLMLVQDKKAMIVKNKKYPFFEPEYYYNYLYFNSGLYYQQVKRYLNLFGYDNIHIIKFDDLKNNFEQTYSEICNFLNIEKNIVSPQIFNKSKSVFLPPVQFILRKINKFLNKRSHNKIITKKERDKLMKLGIINKTPAKMKDKTKKRLQKMYQHDINALSKLTNINFNNWL